MTDPAQLQPMPHRFPRLTLGAIAAELQREAALRGTFYPAQVERGRMTRADADYGLALAQAWIADMARIATALAPLAQGRPALRPSADPGHTLTWRQRHTGLMEELALRARVYAREIDRGRLTRADAAHRTACLAACLAFYDDGLDWPEDPQARAALFHEITARLTADAGEPEFAMG